MFPFFFILYSSEAVREGKNTGKNQNQLGRGYQRQALLTPPGPTTLKNESEGRMRKRGTGSFSTLCSSLFHHLPLLQMLVTVYHAANTRYTNSTGTPVPAHPEA